METKQAIEARYSCREFLDEQISDSDRDEIINAANYAPVGMRDYPSFELLVIQDKAIISKIDETMGKIIPFGNGHPTFGAPTLFVITSKKNEKIPGINYASGSCIAENIMIQAADLGLDSCYLMALPAMMQDKKEMLELLKVKEGFYPIIIVPVGYAAHKENKDRSNRLETRIIK